MKYIEKDIQGKPINMDSMDMSMFNKMAKLPRFLIKFLLKKNIGLIRESMGGDVVIFRNKQLKQKTVKLTDGRVRFGYKSMCLKGKKSDHYSCFTMVVVGLEEVCGL